MSKVSLRLESNLRDLASKIAETHGATDFSDYVRGLLIADAIAAGEKISGLGIDIPSWILGDKIEVHAREQTDALSQGGREPSRKSKRA